jgi:uncharacterized protein YdaL
MSKVYCENAPVIYFLFIYKNKIIDFEILSYIYYKEKYVCCNLTFIKKNPRQICCNSQKKITKIDP